MTENKNVRVENGIAELNTIIEADCCDMAACWRPSAIVTEMQRATHYAREALGIDWGALAEKGGLWVVSRMNVKFRRLPRMGEKIILQAIPFPPIKALHPWYFNFSDSEGNFIGEADTLWNLMDAKTRRLLMLPEINAKIPAPPEGTGRRPLPSAACELETQARRQRLTPLYTDLDINGHASHLRYIDWCCNAMGHELMGEYAISEFRISYMQEVRAAQTVDTELRTDGLSFSFAGYNNDTIAFVIDGKLHRREQ